MSIIIGSGITLGAGISALQEIPEDYLWAWGKNDVGQLGLGDTVNRSSPVQVGALGTWSQVSGPHIGNFTHAVKTDGTLWAWGDQNVGQLGLGDAVAHSSPTQVGALTNWTNSLMPAASQRACYVKSNGQAWLFGNAGYIFNNPFGTAFSSPVQVSSDKTWAFAACGPNTSWFGITTGGALWSVCYGNTDGISGQNNTTNTSSPAQVGALTNWAGVYPGNAALIARKTDGTLWSWGKGSGNNRPKAFLGQNDYFNRSSPTQIGTLTNWARVSTGKYNALAVKTDGTLWTWGYGDLGALGLGDAIGRSSPVQVGALTGWSTDADKNVVPGSPASIAVKSDGSLWSWGRAYWAVLGNGTGGAGAANKSSPVQVGTLTTWTKVGANYNAAFAIASHAT